MVELAYLSKEWIAALDAAVSTAVAADPAPPAVTVTYRIGERAYHLVLDAAGCRAAEGVAPRSTVIFTMSLASATAVAQGVRPTSVAILAGDIAIGGDVTQLAPWRPVLDQIEDRLHDLSALTRFIEASPSEPR